MELYLHAARYGMIAMILLYVLFTLFYLFKKNQSGFSMLNYLQRLLLFLYHAAGSSILYLMTENQTILIFYAFQVLFFVAFLLFWRKLYPDSSKMLLNNVCMLLCVGFLIQSRLNLDKSIRQFVIVAVAGIGSLLIPWIIRYFRHFDIGWFLYSVVGIGLLGLIYVAGNTEYGAKLSFSIGSTTIQPSEFVKILFVFCTASLLRERQSFKRVFLATAIAGAHVLLLVLSRDLGTALVFFLAYLAMLFVATQKIRYPALGMLAGSAAAVGAFHLFTHVQTRVEVWADPFADPLNSGYQILQSLFAITTGGFFGMGLYEGRAAAIPVASKDFVFSAISEEMGGLTALAVVFLCVMNMLQMLRMSARLSERFEKIVVFGLAVVYASQVLINIGGVTKMIPSTGITLPFISYGGSSILATFILFAIIQGYYIRLEDEEDEL